MVKTDQGALKRQSDAPLIWAQRYTMGAVGARYRGVWRKKPSGTSKTKEQYSYQSSPTFLCYESPTALFASQRNLFRTM